MSVFIPLITSLVASWCVSLMPHAHLRLSFFCPLRTSYLGRFQEDVALHLSLETSGTSGPSLHSGMSPLPAATRLFGPGGPGSGKGSGSHPSLSRLGGRSHGAHGGHGERQDNSFKSSDQFDQEPPPSAASNAASHTHPALHPAFPDLHPHLQHPEQSHEQSVSEHWHGWQGPDCGGMLL